MRIVQSTILFGATKMEHRTIATMQKSQEPARFFLRPILSETKPTETLDRIAAKLFQVWRLTESALE